MALLDDIVLAVRDLPPEAQLKVLAFTEALARPERAARILAEQAARLEAARLLDEHGAVRASLPQVRRRSQVACERFVREQFGRAPTRVARKTQAGALVLTASPPSWLALAGFP